MVRLHSGIKKRLKNMDADQVADRAEDYLESIQSYRGVLNGLRGLVSAKRLRACVRKIDALETEILKLEEKIGKIALRREIEALKLEDYLNNNVDILETLPETEDLGRL